MRHLEHLHLCQVWPLNFKSCASFLLKSLADRQFSKPLNRESSWTDILLFPFYDETFLELKNNIPGQLEVMGSPHPAYRLHPTKNKNKQTNKQTNRSLISGIDNETVWAVCLGHWHYLVQMLLSLQTYARTHAREWKIKGSLYCSTLASLPD